MVLAFAGTIVYVSTIDNGANAMLTYSRHNRYYPKGVFVVRLSAGMDPVAYIARCVAEDKANRLAKQAYSTARPARWWCPATR
jgi:hypothetical protein